jgi:hypothetical protein
VSTSGVICGRLVAVACCVGDYAGGDALGGEDVGPGARRGGDRDGDVLLQAGVPLGVIRGVALPAAPDDPAPGAAEGPQRPLVAMAAGSGAGVAVSSPGVPASAALRQDTERFA